MQHKNLAKTIERSSSAPTCGQCGVSRDTKKGRVPRGWKRHEGVWCNKCWRKSYVLRAIAIPVGRPIGVSWQHFRESIVEAWSHTQACINWMMSQLWARDAHRMPGQEKLGKMPNIYLYPEACQGFPELPSITVSAIEQAVKLKYRAKRYDAIWLGNSSLPSAKYPQPFTCNNQSWTATYQRAGKDGGDSIPCVMVTILRGKKFQLQLRGGQEFRRQLEDFKQLVSGEAIQGSLDIYRAPYKSSKGNGIKLRDSGKQKGLHRIMVKMVAWFPRKPYQGADSILKVRMDTESFLIAFDRKGERLRIWNADHVQRWIAEHRRNIQRLSEDQKAEQRPLAKFQSHREGSALKFRARIDSFCKETAAQIVGIASRLRYESIELDSSCRDYFGDRFNYTGFFRSLTNAANARNIGLKILNDEVNSKQEEYEDG